MSLPLSLNATLNVNTATETPYATPTWTPVKSVKDLSVSIDPDEADTSTRGTGGFKADSTTLIGLPIEVDAVWDPTDVQLMALVAASLSRAAIDCVALDGPSATVGSQGPRAYFSVGKVTRDEKLADVLRVKFTLKPTNAAEPPTWFTVAS
jgi:hypothetical protein